MNDLPRNQHIIASGIVASVGIWVTYISYTQEPAAAFLFPRMISTVFAGPRTLDIWKSTHGAQQSRSRLIHSRN